MFPFTVNAHLVWGFPRHVWWHRRVLANNTGVRFFRFGLNPDGVLKNVHVLSANIVSMSFTKIWPELTANDKTHQKTHHRPKQFKPIQWRTAWQSLQKHVHCSWIDFVNKQFVAPIIHPHGVRWSTQWTRGLVLKMFKVTLRQSSLS